MPSAIDLTTVEIAASVLGVSASDPHLPRLVTAASAAVARYVGYELHQRLGVVETVAGQGGPFLFLRAGAVRSIASVAVNGQELDPSAYALDSASMGRIVGRQAGFPFTGSSTAGISPSPLSAYDTGAIVVTFDAGYVTPGQKALDGSLAVDLPPELEQATLEVVTAWYRQRGHDARIGSISLGGGSVSYSELTALPATAKQLLAPYRKATRRLF